MKTSLIQFTSLLFYIYFLIGWCGFSLSQPGSLDLSFEPGSGTNFYVNASAVQSDEKILIGGDFNSYNGTVTNRIARIMPQGSLDTSFNIGSSTNGIVNTIVVQNDGKILIGGFFSSYNGTTINSIARLMPDGSLDLSFNPGSGTNNYIWSIAVQIDGKILIGGEFTSYDGTSINRIARLNVDGSLDFSFNPGTGADGYVKTSVVQNDGKILIGGYFINFNGTARNYLARLMPDGSLDLSFDPGVGPDQIVLTIALQNDGRIVIGGPFTFYDGTPRNYIARLIPDGTLDVSFNPVSGANDIVNTIVLQLDGKIIIGGKFTSYNGIARNYIARIMPDGFLDFSFKPGDGANFHVYTSTVQSDGKIIIGGAFSSYNGTPRNYIARLHGDKGLTYGKLFLDLNEDCVQNPGEKGIEKRAVMINPSNYVVQTNENGYWQIDSLPAGNYSVIADTSGKWKTSCQVMQDFTVVSSDSITIAPSFGFISTEPCPSPNVSVNMPRMRPCFTGQKIYVQACNEYDGTGVLPDAYSIVVLDPNLIFESASLPYTSLGNNQYRFEHDTLYPGQCVNYTISTQVDCNAPLGLTLCMEANLYPVADCVLDSIPTPPTGEVTPCTLPWDQSSLSVDGWCANDSIYFMITNTGELGGGDMECYSPVRVYVDGVPYLLDSIKLLGAESFTYVFAGNGATWILEVDQHPLHPGNSHPNAHVENCNPGNWTPDIVNDFPTDDADPVKDIYCGVVTGSYDPNDKKGTPYGLGAEHEVLPNQDIEYLIRFQNTGTDTAFTVVVRDTLDIDFDIFSVTPGSASHNYSFRMYGPRVLEWTFANILLPDSTTNEPLSNGFLSYRVKQKPNLADGTLLTNKADIYFDFNVPIITNETSHKVQRRTFEPTNSLVSLSQTKTGIKLYPNPTKQETTLSFSTYQKQVSYKLLNLSGQVLLEKSNLYGKEIKVNLSEIPNGMYLMEISTNQGTQIMKVMKE